jgi:hypothetical protein
MLKTEPGLSFHIKKHDSNIQVSSLSFPFFFMSVSYFQQKGWEMIKDMITMMIYKIIVQTVEKSTLAKNYNF